MSMPSCYDAYIRGVVELHELGKAGKEDSPEADAIRDATDLLWEGLSEGERERVGNFSEDLYMQNGASPAPPGLPEFLSD